MPSTNDREKRSPEIELRDGRRGVVLARQDSSEGVPLALVRLDDGEHVLIPLGALELRGDRTLVENSAGEAPSPPAAAEPGLAPEASATPEIRATARVPEEVAPGETLVVPLAEEEVALRRRIVESGRVRVRKRVESRREAVEVPRSEVEVEVERVAIGRYVDAPPELRREGEITIVPILEEVLVVEKRLLLKEEVRIRQRRTTSTERVEVELRSEHASVEPSDGAGEASDPALDDRRRSA